MSDAKDSGNTAELEVLKKAIEKEKDELLNEVADAFDVKSDVSLAAEDLKKVMFLNRQLLDFE
ncbi:MAG: iron-sulfur cluster co-chaperone HscB C-terminal domain-containing protein [Parasutterella excrementihominis]